MSDQIIPETPSERPPPVVIRGDAEKELHFLAEVMGNKSWSADIPLKTLTEEQTPLSIQHSLSSIENSLAGKSFVTEIIKREDGQPVLHVEHLGAETGIRQNVGEFGVTKGLKHTAGNLADRAQEKGRDLLNYITSDKARTMAFFYMMGEANLMLAGLVGGRDKEEQAAKDSILTHFAKKLTSKITGNAYEQTYAFDLKDTTANTLQFLYGGLGSVQSAIFLTYAHQGSEKQVKELSYQFEEAMKAGKDPLDISQWTDKDPAIVPALGPLDKLMRKYPIHAGSIAQGTASACIIGANVLFKQMNEEKLKQANLDSDREKAKELKKNIQGNIEGALRGVNSTIGWGLMMTPGKKIEGEKAGGLKGVVQSAMERPNRISSVQFAVSSILGISSSKKKENFFETTGEAIYLLGDVTSYFLKTDEYGKSGQGAEKFAAKAATEFLQNSHFILDSETQKGFVEQLSGYIARQMEIASPDQKADPGLAGRIADAAFERLAETESKLENIAYNTAQVLAHLPEENRPALQQELVEKITGMEQVYVEPEALHQLIDGQMKTLEQRGLERNTTNAPSMIELAPNVSAIVLHLPPLHAAENAAGLFETITPHMERGSRDAEHFQHATAEQAAEISGLPVRAIKEMQRDIQQTELEFAR